MIPQSEPGTRRYVCMLCMYVYDESVGDPDSGLPPGTLWEDIPEDWSCPKCGAAKGYFEPEARFLSPGQDA
jgi:rubredoxin---NAD+ reductase